MSIAERSSLSVSVVLVGSSRKRGLRPRKNLPIANGRRFDCGVQWLCRLAVALARAGSVVLASRQVR